MGWDSVNLREGDAADMILKIRLKRLACVIACLCIPVSAFFAASSDFNTLNKTALVSASLIMPEGGFSVITSNIFDKEAISGEVYSIIQSSKLPLLSDGSKPVKTPQATGLNYTPDDIARAMAEYEKNKDSLSNDGVITEVQYSSAQANAVSGNIWVQNKTDKQIDIDALLSQNADLKIEDKSKPSVLIYHTHTTESFQMLDLGFFSNSLSSRNSDNSLNMVRVGDEIAAQLEKAGFKVIHDTNTYDTTYSGSYYRSEEQVRKYLKENPSIKITLDIHRDAIGSGKSMVKPTAVIDGKKAAQVMIITGCEENGVVNFPDWEYNLRFALQLQKSMQETYSGLARPVFFCDRVYNMNVNRNSLLVEFGTNANTLDEAAYSGRLFGASLAKMLEKYVD